MNVVLISSFACTHQSYYSVHSVLGDSTYDDWTELEKLLRARDFFLVAMTSDGRRFLLELVLLELDSE
jgi:hypothetical protein